MLSFHKRFQIVRHSGDLIVFHKLPENFVTFDFKVFQEHFSNNLHIY
jgi:hypothetical protein